MIVWYHAGAGAQEIAYGGLIVFLIISTYLAAKAGNRSIEIGLKEKFKRLVLPWALWMLIYGAVNIFWGKPIAPEYGGLLNRLLCGTAPHLWYMPFIFFVLLLIDVAKNNISPLVLGAASGVVAAAILFTVAIWRDYSILLGYPLAQYCHAAAGVMIGLFFGYRSRMPRYAFLSLFALIVASAIYALSWRGVGVTYLVGLLFGSALSFEWFKDVNFHSLEKLAPYTLGIYFVHILILWAVSKLHISDLAEFFLTLTLSAVLVVAASKRFPSLVRYWA